MTERIVPTIFLASILTLGLASSAAAGVIIETLPSYDSPGYDFSSTFPPAGSTTIGTFTFTPLTGIPKAITISGTFGNGDSPTPALSDYYLGFAGDETAVEVAACDDPSANCSSNSNGPTPWSLTLTQTEISALAPGLANGSLDFTYTWDSPPFAFPGFNQYVYSGATTIDITPEPATLLVCFSGLAGIVALRRLRKI